MQGLLVSGAVDRAQTFESLITIPAYSIEQLFLYGLCHVRRLAYRFLRCFWWFELGRTTGIEV